MGRERGRSAIEPHARRAPPVSPALPCAPEESHALLWTQSGGLSPPPVLGAGAARTTSKPGEPGPPFPSSHCLTTPLTPFASLAGLSAGGSARRRPRDPPPSRAPGRNPTPVGGAVTCFSSRLHMCRLHVAAHMSAHVRARGATVMHVRVRRCIRTYVRGHRLCSVLAYFRVMM